MPGLGSGTIGTGTYGGLVPPAGTYDPRMPSLMVDLALDAGPFDVSPTWTALGEWVLGLTVTRGRSDETETTAAGTCTLTIDNSDGRFDVENSDGPYFGRLLMNTRIRVRANWQGVTFPIFAGFLDGWPAMGDTTRDYNETQVGAADLFRLVAERRIEPTRAFTIGDAVLGRLDDPTVQIAGWPVAFPEERAGDRIAKIARFLGLPDELVDIDPGKSFVVADTPEGAALEYAQILERSDGGRLFVAADGRLTYRTRNSGSTVPTVAASQATFTDQATGGLPYVAAEFDPGSPGRVRNVIVRGREDRTVRAVDTTSVARFGPIEDAQTDLLAADLEDLNDNATYHLARYRDAVPQCLAFTVAASNNATGLFPHILGRELGDRVTVERTAIGGRVVSADYHIEGISHSVDRFGDWSTTWTLSRADTATYFTIGDAVAGALDGTAVLAW